MIEIKFRAWLKQQNNMVNVDAIDFVDKRIKYIAYEYQCYPIEKILSFEDVELMQFTGIKDKNGKEIYEGDILKCHYEDYNKTWDETFEIIYFNGTFGLKTFDEKHFISFFSSTHRYCEVIGNIYENKELIENANPV